MTEPSVYNVGSWMLIDPLLAAKIIYILSAISILGIVLCLFVKNNGKRGWLLLAASLPLMIAGSGVYVNNSLCFDLIFLFPFEDSHEFAMLWGTYIKAFMYPLFAAFLPGVIGMLLGLYHIRGDKKVRE